MSTAQLTSKPKLGAQASAVAGPRTVAKPRAASQSIVAIPLGPAIKLKDNPALKDPRFAKVMEKLKKSAARSKQHPPVTQRANEAQAAALPPEHEKLAGAKANNVDQMQGAPTSKPESQSFLQLLRAQIAEVMPKKTEDAKDFMKGDDKQQIKGAMTGNISQQKEQAAGGIKSASKGPLDETKVPGKEVTALSPVAVPGTPPAIGAADALPAPKTDADISLEQGKKDADKAMSDAKLSTPQLQKANDPRFSGVLTAKQKVYRA